MCPLTGTLAHFLFFAYIVYGSTDWAHEVAVVAERTKEAQKQSRVRGSSGGYESAGDTDSESWWDELSFTLDGSGDSDPGSRRRGSTGSESSRSPVRDVGVVAKWISAARALFGAKEVKTEYELVRTYTDSLSPLHLDEEEEEVEIDFDLVM